MYGVEWLIVLGLLGLAAGLGVGYLLAGAGGGSGRRRELEQQLDTARRELDEYRQEVVSQFSETARKFQTLNDAYTDLHEQLAKSSSVLCADLSGPLLAAPTGHQDLLSAEAREAPPAAAGEAVTEGITVDPYDDGVDIRVPEPTPAGRAGGGTDAAGDPDEPPETPPRDAAQPREAEAPRQARL